MERYIILKEYSLTDTRTIPKVLAVLDTWEKAAERAISIGAPEAKQVTFTNDQWVITPDTRRITIHRVEFV